MLSEKRNELFTALMIVLMRRTIRRRFHGVYLCGGEHLASLPIGRSVIACSNHTNWWDGFVAALLLARLPRRKLYMVQEEQHLARYWFMRYCGVMGVDLDAPHAAIGLVRRANSLLQSPDALLWIFPQGRLCAPEAPIVVKRGTTYLAKKTGAPILPCAFRYEFRDEQFPSVFVQIGRPLDSTSPVESVAAAIQELVHALKPFAESTVPLPPDRLLSGRKSINRRWDQVRPWVPH